MKVPVLIIASLIILRASPALCWGPKGHEVVVRLALKLMKPEERKAVIELLGSDNPAWIGNWADREERKNHPETKPWHYVDIPARAAKYKESRDCQNPCIITQIQWAKATACDRRFTREHRREALLWWFHLAGDLLQPFHCIDRRDGGNTTTIRYKHKQTNLHKLWDSNILHEQEPSASRLDSIIWSEHDTTKRSLDIMESVNLSHDRAVEALLPNNATVTYSYVHRWWPVIRRSLWQAACLAATIGPELLK
jgi:hypothetical protein